MTAAVALALAAAAVITGAAFALGRITSPHRPRPGATDLDLVAAAVLELQHIAHNHAAELSRQRADLDSVFARRHRAIPAPLGSADRRRRAAIDTAGRTTEHQTVGA